LFSGNDSESPRKLGFTPRLRDGHGGALGGNGVGSGEGKAGSPGDSEPKLESAFGHDEESAKQHDSPPGSANMGDARAAIRRRRPLAVTTTSQDEQQNSPGRSQGPLESRTKALHAGASQPDSDVAQPQGGGQRPSSRSGSGSGSRADQAGKTGSHSLAVPSFLQRRNGKGLSLGGGTPGNKGKGRGAGVGLSLEWPLSIKTDFEVGEDDGTTLVALALVPVDGVTSAGG